MSEVFGSPKSRSGSLLFAVLAAYYQYTAAAAAAATPNTTTTACSMQHTNTIKTYKNKNNK